MDFVEECLRSPPHIQEVTGWNTRGLAILNGVSASSSVPPCTVSKRNEQRQ